MAITAAMAVIPEYALEDLLTGEPDEPVYTGRHRGKWKLKLRYRKGVHRKIHQQKDIWEDAG